MASIGAGISYHRGARMVPAFWSLDANDLSAELGSSPRGLSTAEAEHRLLETRGADLQPGAGPQRLDVLWRQIKSPLLLLLVFAAVVSASAGEWSDAVIVGTIVTATIAIGYTREYRAETAVAALRARIRADAKVVRDGREAAIPRTDVVPGDVVQLAAGSLVPADGVILEATDFFVSEAMLTGESFPVEKHPGVVAAAAGIGARTNVVYLGTNVRSGTATCLVVHTGADTEFGAIARRLSHRAPETDFDRGIRRFGYLLTITMVVIVLLVFAAHVIRGRPPIETLLFSVALAIGLSPELLPAILSVNLARGAHMMARRGVLVRRLNAIENLGSMDVLCTDKTGTLTEGVVRLDGAYDADGVSSDAVLDAATLNAALETGLDNPLDAAILQGRTPTVEGVLKLAEIPFDFVRKRVSVIVERQDAVELITKGAFGPVLEICVRTTDGAPLDDARRAAIGRRYETWSAEGIRVIAVAGRTIDKRDKYSRADEDGLTFLGFLTFLDRPKDGARQALADLSALGVGVKIITGDNRLVARHVAGLVGMAADELLTGSDLATMDDPALWRLAERTTVFAEVDPNQKERILHALRKCGHVVGFLGDGVNDAPAMHAADTSLSVEQAVDVAREAADFVLLERDLDVIRGGIEEGRRTFANTLKYILTTTSANLGNMISMAAASLFLPFLPMLASQILLNNLLADVPAFGIADDSVDREMVERPPRWDIRFIGRFMVVFGVLSSAFDFLTFGVLLFAFHASVPLFRTGWFVESLLTELVIALVVRTRRPFYRSRPGRVLLGSSIAMTVLALGIPYLPGAGLFAFVPLPLLLAASLVAIAALYVAATELTKRRFYREVRVHA
jgi:Mg2+-importing ATPase